jgi:hypothetical protein
VAQLLQEGQAAFNKGDYATAKNAFEMVYQMDSRNVVAINYLTKLKTMPKNPTGGTPEQQLGSLIIPTVALREATIGAVFDYLRTTAVKLSDGKVKPNFVLNIPDTQLKTQTVTLNMSNAPFTEVVKYIAELANLNVQYQRYAVLVTPKGGAVPPAPPAPVNTPEITTDALPGMK